MSAGMSKELALKYVVEPDNTAPAVIDNAALRELPGGFHFDTHMHHSVEIVVCRRGTLTITAQDDVQEVRAGEYLVVFPNVLHRADVRGTEPCCILQMHFNRSGLLRESRVDELGGPEGFLLELALEKRKFLRGGATEQLEACINGIRLELDCRRCGQDEMMDSYIRQLFILLSRDLKENGERPVRRNPHLIRASLYIGSHCTGKITVADVAASVGVSPRYLTRLFQEQLGLGVAAYIAEMRISRSIDFMFRNPGYPLSRLALDMGFSSQQHFSRVFKEKMGVPPGKYFSRLPVADY